MNDKEISYINEFDIQRYHRKKQKYRILFGIGEFIHKPILNIVWITLITIFIICNYFMRRYINRLEIPQILIPVYKYLPTIMLVTILIVFVIGILIGIAELKSREDEAYIREAFRDYRGDKMPPILVFRKKLKNNRCIRQFYSFYTVEEWTEKKREIETCLNVQIIGEIENEKNRRIVSIKSFDGKISKRKEVLYDDEF